MNTPTTGSSPPTVPMPLADPSAPPGSPAGEQATALEGGAARDRSHELVAFRRLRTSTDPALREQLIARYLGLADRLAGRYVNGGRASYEDVVQVARVGLVAAVDRFDPDRGLAFATFAVPMVLGEIKRYFCAGASATHVPHSLPETGLDVERAARKLSMRDGRNPTVAALAAELDADEEWIIDALERSALRQAARTPSDRDHLILKLRFEDSLTQQQIADRTGASQMHVSGQLRRSLRSLREPIEASGVSLL